MHGEVLCFDTMRYTIHSRFCSIPRWRWRPVFTKHANVETLHLTYVERTISHVPVV